MPKLYSSSEIKTVLMKLKYSFYSQKGSHGKFKNSEGFIVILPMNKKEIPYGTYRSILKQAGISQEEFLKLLNN